MTDTADEGKRGREDEQEEPMVGPPVQPPGADDGGDDDDQGIVGPAMPKTKKRKVHVRQK